MSNSIKHEVSGLIILILVVQWCNTAIVHADFVFNDFSVGPDLNLLDSASFVSNRLRLTPASTDVNGTVIHNDKQFMQAGFETRFAFEISAIGGSPDADGNLGGDGFALIVQTQGATAASPFVDYIPYSIPNAFVIEFDTWRNSNLSDPSGNHISVQPVGASPDQFSEYHHNNSLGSTSSIPNMSAGVHDVLVSYAPGTLHVFIDDLLTPALTVPIDLTNVNGVNRLDADGKAWVGLAGGTGDAFENHDILNWSFTSVPEPSSLMLLLGFSTFGICRRRQR